MGDHQGRRVATRRAERGAGRAPFRGRRAPALASNAAAGRQHRVRRAALPAPDPGNRVGLTGAGTAGLEPLAAASGQLGERRARPPSAAPAVSRPAPAEGLSRGPRRRRRKVRQQHPSRGLPTIRPVAFDGGPQHRLCLDAASGSSLSRASVSRPSCTGAAAFAGAAAADGNVQAPPPGRGCRRGARDPRGGGPATGGSSSMCRSANAAASPALRNRAGEGGALARAMNDGCRAASAMVETCSVAASGAVLDRLGVFVVVVSAFYCSASPTKRQIPGIRPPGRTAGRTAPAVRVGGNGGAREGRGA